MRWVSNIYDPKQPDAMYYVVTCFGQSMHEAWQQHQQWLSDKIIGEPNATQWFTVERLKAMKMVGVYITDETDQVSPPQIVLSQPSDD